MMPAPGPTRSCEHQGDDVAAVQRAASTPPAPGAGNLARTEGGDRRVPVDDGYRGLATGAELDEPAEVGTGLLNSTFGLSPR